MQKKSKSKIITDMKKLESWVNCLETSRKRSQKGQKEWLCPGRQEGRKQDGGLAFVSAQILALQLTV